MANQISNFHRVIRAADVLKRIRISKTQLYRLIQSGSFPRPTKLSERVVVWEEKAVDDWLAQKLGVAK